MHALLLFLSSNDNSNKIWFKFIMIIRGSIFSYLILSGFDALLDLVWSNELQIINGLIILQRSNLIFDRPDPE